MMRSLCGWGRYPVISAEWEAASTLRDVQVAASTSQGLILRGNGRAYGDAAIGLTKTLGMTGLDRMISFDPATGLLRAEAGVMLADIIAAYLPRGYFPFVVPGTRYVTIGGAIAADVHGKNHHKEGSFGRHVVSLSVVTPSGAVVVASRENNQELFFNTIGGMGLTGAIVEATLCLRPVETGWVRQQTLVAGNLAEAIAILDRTKESTYSVAWIDCVAKGAQLGRSLVFLGEHAGREDLRGEVSRSPFPPIASSLVGVPFAFPSYALNRYSVGAFNEAYFRNGKRKAGEAFLTSVIPFFFPLDSIDNWNRIYGSRGFIQHQCVLPPATAAAALTEMLDRIVRRGDASFLAVLKKLGGSEGVLSFPMEGFTLALDFPMSAGLLEFLAELDQVVVKAGGRLYLAKDACQLRSTFDAGYPAASGFRAFRRERDLAGNFASHLSNRLGL